MSPGQAEPRSGGIAQSHGGPHYREKTEREKAEEYRKWKEGEGHALHPHTYLESESGRYGLYLGSGVQLVEQWKLKLGLTTISTSMLLIPYFSYWLWFVLLPPLRVIVPSSPSLQLDVFTDNFHEPTIWGSWFVGGGAFLPSLLGFLLFLTYFYFLNNMFIPKYKWKQHAFISILWIWFYISWITGIPPSPFEW
tara:strand:- start:23 stop:604 length:582 start_codon:yes stop_codon:yes gene_type:complete